MTYSTRRGYRMPCPSSLFMISSQEEYQQLSHQPVERELDPKNSLDSLLPCQNTSSHAILRIICTQHSTFVHQYMFRSIIPRQNILEHTWVEIVTQIKTVMCSGSILGKRREEKRATLPCHSVIDVYVQCWDQVKYWESSATACMQEWLSDM